MKAVSSSRYGGIDVLRVIDALMPKPNGSEVLVKIKAAGLNPGEIAIREGYLESMFHTDFPCGEGTDFAGIVSEVGAGVTKFKSGDEVVGYTHNRASHAEYLAVSENNIIAKPVNVAWDVAGSLFVAGTTAYAGVQAVQVSAGDTVVVSGAAGGVGLIAAQLAVFLGAKVIGIANKNYHDWLNNHGIIPVDYTADVASQISAITEQVDAFIDTVGGDYVELAVNLGVALDRINTCIDFKAAQKFKVKADGSAAAGNIKVLQELIELIAEGKLDVPISKSYSLDQVQDAYTYLATKHDIGKVVFSAS